MASFLQVPQSPDSGLDLYRFSVSLGGVDEMEVGGVGRVLERGGIG